MVLPPMIDHGWASGLAGTAKSSTAEAPSGATSSGRCSRLPTAQPEMSPVMPMPMSAPRQAMPRSRKLVPAMRGVRPRSAARKLFCMARQAKGILPREI